MVDRKINVLHLLLSLEIGGMERFVYEHCLEIDKKLFNISVCCIDRLGGFSEKLKENGIKVDLLRKNQNHFDYLFCLKLSKYLKNNKIDILHIHSGAFFHGSVAGVLSKTSKIIYTEHGRHYVEPLSIYFLDKISSFFVHKIVTVSPELKTHLIEKIKLPSKKITTIINGVNTKEFSPRGKSEKMLAEFGIPSDYKVIGSVGRLVEIKDYFTLIQAFARVLVKIPKSKLVLVGEGPCLGKLKELASELNVFESVIFTGSRADVPQILNIFDVFVLPSLLEGTSFSLLEAMATGVPVVVTNVGGNPSIVKDDYNGYTVDPKDSITMSEKIENLLLDIIKANRFKVNGIKLVEERYSLLSNINEYINLYKMS